MVETFNAMKDFKYCNNIVSGYIHEMFKFSTCRYSARSLMVSTLKSKHRAEQFIFSEPKERSNIYPNIDHFQAIDYFMQAPKEKVLLHLQRQANSNINWLNFSLSLLPLPSTNGFIYALKKAVLFHYKHRLNQIIFIPLLLSSLLSIQYFHYFPLLLSIFNIQYCQWVCLVYLYGTIVCALIFYGK